MELISVQISIQIIKHPIHRKLGNDGFTLPSCGDNHPSYGIQIYRGQNI